VSIARRVQVNNLTQRLQDAGVSANNVTDYIYDLSGDSGGPIAKTDPGSSDGADYRTNNRTNTFQDNVRQARTTLHRDASAASPTRSTRNCACRLLRSHQQFRSTTCRACMTRTASTSDSEDYSTGSIKLTSTLTSRCCSKVDGR